MKIYVVVGETGIFEDRMCWNVFAFKSREEAEKYVCFLEEMYNPLCVNDSQAENRDYSSRNSLEEKMRKYDPNFKELDIKTEWHIEELELKEMP